MTCRAIIICQPYYDHWLPSLACHASCTSPAFAVVRRTWDVAIRPDSSFSSQSLLPPLHNAVNNTELLTRRIGKNLRYFHGQAVFFLLHGCLLNLPSYMAHLSIRKNPCLFQWFNRDGAARPSPESSQAFQRTEHYASVAYRLVYFIQRLFKLIVNQQTTHLQKTRCCA